MTLDVNADGFTIAVVGAGVMGRGIAQIAAAGGAQVLLFDAHPGAAEDAEDFIQRMLKRAAEREVMTTAQAAEAIGRIRVVADLVQIAQAGLVVEAIIEDLEAKRELFRALEATVAPDAVLATNTSSLSVTAIAAACERPERVAGFHFFNPVPLLKLVEVVEGVLTAPWVGDALEAAAKRFGHTSVRAKDTPGFLVNHAGRGLGTEGLRLVAEGVTDFAGVDDVLREGGAGFRMGPFELMDVTGLDVSGVVLDSIYHQFYEEPRFRPHPIIGQRMAAGLYGRKTSHGFYLYEDGKKVAPPAATAGEGRPAEVWVSRAAPDGHEAVTTRLQGIVPLADDVQPDASAVTVVTPIGEDATSAALQQGLNPERTVAIDTLFGLDGRITLMTTPVTDRALAQGLADALRAAGIAVTLINDSPGFIAQRVVATIVNIGCEIAQMRIARPDHIDMAVKLGLAYPHGPLGFGDAVGPAHILRILEALHGLTGDPRYRPSLWLTRRARLGVSLLTLEG